MTSIHPYAYLIIGAVVAGYSKFVEYRNEESYLTPFFWIGLVFLFIGLMKLGLRKLNKENKKKDETFQKQYKQVDEQFQRQKPFNTYDPNRDKQKPF